METALDSKALLHLMILGEEISWKAFHHGVHWHQIKFRLNSALIFTVTAMSEGLFAPLEGCLFILGAIMVVFHSFLAQYFETSIVYIFCFPVELPLWQS